MVIHKDKTGKDQLLFKTATGAELIDLQDILDLLDFFDEEEDLEEVIAETRDYELIKSKATDEELDELANRLSKEFKEFVEENEV